MVSQLEKRGIRAEAFHSGRSQASREQVLSEFKDGSLQYLVATGVAARGIDVDKLERVVNYDLPFPPDEYIHRIGRTGRAGMTGEAVSLLSKDDFKNLCMIESRLGHVIERRVIEGFEPKKPIPVSILDYKPSSQRSSQRKAQPSSELSSQPSSQRNSQPSSQRKSRPEKPKASEGGTEAKSPWATAQRKKPANPQRGTGAARSGTPKGQDSAKPRG